MAIEPKDYADGSLEAYVDAALEGMKDDLMPGDLAIVGVIRMSAQAWDNAVAEGKPGSAMAFLAYVTNGVEKLGGSALARKQLGKKDDKKPGGLAEVRALRSVAPGASDKTASKPKPAARKPRPRKQGA